MFLSSFFWEEWHLVFEPLRSHTAGCLSSQAQPQHAVMEEEEGLASTHSLCTRALSSDSWLSPCHKNTEVNPDWLVVTREQQRALQPAPNLSYCNYLEKHPKTFFLQAWRWMLFIPAVFQSVKMKQKRNPRLLTFSGFSGFHLCSKAVQTGLKKEGGGRNLFSFQFTIAVECMQAALV